MDKYKDKTLDIDVRLMICYQDDFEGKVGQLNQRYLVGTPIEEMDSIEHRGI